MRITYEQLARYLSLLSPSQLQCDVTVQIDDEFYAADFRIYGEGDVLDENHPVICIPHKESPNRATNEEVTAHIEAIEAAGGFGLV